MGVREHPVIFQADSIRAILARRKSQTRRAINPQPPETMVRAAVGVTGFWVGWDAEGNEVWNAYCPYGVPGDRLYVREKWGTSPGLDHVRPRDLPSGASIHYAADDICESGGWRVERWRPSIHMPRWASRITLEVARVRVQRVQDITEEDATAEGMCYAAGGCCEWCNGSRYNHTWPSGCPHCGATGHTHRYHFQALWDRINLRRGYGFDTNCRVWVIDFPLLPEAVRDALP